MKRDCLTAARKEGEMAALMECDRAPHPVRARGRLIETSSAKNAKGLAMAFSFSRCRAVILQGILKGIRLRARKIARIATEQETVTGISLDLVPWHREVGLSLRQSSEHWDDKVRYCNVEWAYFDLVSEQTCRALRRAADFVHAAYTSEESNRLAAEMAHMIFLAGAEALLDAQVAMAFSQLGIDAPTCGDDFMPRPFEYMVFDFDGTVRGNYCDLVLANRVAARWLPRLN
jgi:hypothetical protein